jgi:hypothetical protein
MKTADEPSSLTNGGSLGSGGNARFASKITQFATRQPNSKKEQITA